MNTPNSSEIGLNLHLLSFSFTSYLIKHDVRVIVSTYPESNKQEFVIKARNILYPNHVLSFNVSKNAKIVFIFFQKKILMAKDPIIACATIPTTQFPENLQKYDYQTSGRVSGEVITQNIFEYTKSSSQKDFQKPELSENTIQNPQKINGQIEIQITMTEPFLMKDINNHTKNNKKSKKNKNKNQEKAKNNKDDVKIVSFEQYSQLEKKNEKKIRRRSKCCTDYMTIN